MSIQLERSFLGKPHRTSEQESPSRVVMQGPCVRLKASSVGSSFSGFKVWYLPLEVLALIVTLLRVDVIMSHQAAAE